jgi:hypothetical protein
VDLRKLLHQVETAPVGSPELVHRFIIQLCGLLRERKVCTSDVWAFRVAPAHEEPRSGSNNSEHDSTIDRSTNYGSGHLIRVFRDIAHIFSLLFLLTVARWSPAEKEGSKAEDGIWFRRRQKRFQLCFVRNSSRWTSRAATHSLTRTPPDSQSGPVSEAPPSFPFVFAFRNSRGSSCRFR